MKKLTKNSIRSEAALKRALNSARAYHWTVVVGARDVEVLAHSDRAVTVATVSLRKFIAKRKPLKGVTKKLRKAIR